MLLSFFAYIFTLPYRWVLWIRNKCYDWGVFKSVSLDIPVVSIGNISVGGTGKTPHTELVLRLFCQEIQIAVLSRGYRRASRGFRYVDGSDSVSDVGDEPLQIKRKFPSVVVAVDVDRVAGISRIRKDHPHVGLIVLDDAFQYRRLKPTFSILLSDYNRPYTQDLLLPFGRLRDLKSQTKRADMIIVTKTPPQSSSAEWEHQCKLLKPNSNQKLLFTCYTYYAPYRLFGERTNVLTESSGNEIIALTGIAQPQPFLDKISNSGTIVQHLKFSDHHFFSRKDICRIDEAIVQYPHAVIYTTEKDAMRLSEAPTLSLEAKAKIYVVSIQIDFCTTEDKNLFKKCLSLVNFLNRGYTPT
ncbi:MAG: tetraacyldisaccharide 4'-kinase [Bacteroidales bacterium]|nr:tetraacyldisaccharide 4'-kinase [Bacteroidales bacterium]